MLIERAAQIESTPTVSELLMTWAVTHTPLSMALTLVDADLTWRAQGWTLPNGALGHRDASPVQLLETPT
jgi:hypothetical protein